MFRTLMTSRRFAPLFWRQFLSAFNDNFIRNMLAMLILFRFGGESASLKILFGTIVFIVPAIPLSALGGFDRAHGRTSIPDLRHPAHAACGVRAIGDVARALRSGCRRS